MKELLQECCRGHNKLFSDSKKVNLSTSKIFSVEQAKIRITLGKKPEKVKNNTWECSKGSCQVQQKDRDLALEDRTQWVEGNKQLRNLLGNK